jgi:hypothetical protein
MLVARPLPPGVHVTWQDNSSDEDGFLVMRKLGSQDFASIMTLPANSTQFHDSTASSGQTYTYMVHAKRGDELSLPSNQVTVEVP